MAIVPIGPDGKIYLRNQAGSIHVAVDVFGYFKEVPDDSTTGRIVPLEAPFRAFDTRLPEFGNLPLGTGSVEDWSFSAFTGSVQDSTGAALGEQSALIGNLTGTGLQRVYPRASVSTFLSAYPGGASRPLVSNLNITEGEVVPNMSLMNYGPEQCGQAPTTTRQPPLRARRLRHRPEVAACGFAPQTSEVVGTLGSTESPG